VTLNLYHQARHPESYALKPYNPILTSKP
jgi:hypothetical protein